MVHTDQIGHLIVNNEDQGLLEINAAIGPFWGDMLELGNNLCKISDNGLNCLSTRWLGGVEIEYAKFVDEKGECVYLRNWSYFTFTQLKIIHQKNNFSTK